MPATSVEDEVATPTTESRDVAKSRTSLKQKLFRRVSASSLSKSAKLHRQVVSAEVACNSERGCYCTPAETASVRLISVKRRDPEAEFTFSVPPKQANATCFGPETGDRRLGDGVSQRENGRMENGPSTAKNTEVQVVSEEAVDGEAKATGKGRLTGEDETGEPARAVCCTESRGQPQDDAGMEARDQTGPVTTHGK
ncbi:hypothetical protein LSAT2_028933 [Lamellibrachia satsuma]|nr:hypothetical protein LSAT2_028933 [Lamellibrachia satsuma]